MMFYVTWSNVLTKPHNVECVTEYYFSIKPHVTGTQMNSTH